jgi:hypothetical protein
MTRMGRVWFQLAAQPGDVEPQVMSLTAVSGSPHVTQHPPRRHKLAGFARGFDFAGNSHRLLQVRQGVAEGAGMRKPDAA